MSATTWLIIAIVGFSLSGIALVAAIFMFIKMNIPAVIGYLTGKTVAREIKAMRDANTSSSNKLYKSSEPVNDEEIDSSVRAVAHASKRLDRTGTDHSSYLKNNETGEQPSGALSKDRTTETLSANVGEVDIEERRSTAILSQNRVTDVLVKERKTDILTESPETAVLSETRQTEVFSETRQTEVLSEADTSTGGRGGTTVLSETDEPVQNTVKPVAFKVTRSVIKTHTDEVI